MSEWYYQFSSFDDYKSYLQNKLEDFKEEEIWKGAKAIKDLETYLAQYPKGKYVDQAKEKIEDLRWKNAKSKNTIRSYEQFLSKHPNGKYVDEAKKRIERIREANLWKRAKSNNTQKMYKKYLDTYPNGQYVDEAIARIETLDEEEHWKSIQNSKTIKVFKEYLKKYPKGKYVIEAKSKIEEISLHNKRKRNLEEIINIFGHGRYIKHYDNDLGSGIIVEENLLFFNLFNLVFLIFGSIAGAIMSFVIGLGIGALLTIVLPNDTVNLIFHFIVTIIFIKIIITLLLFMYKNNKNRLLIGENGLGIIDGDNIVKNKIQYKNMNTISLDDTVIMTLPMYMLFVPLISIDKLNYYYYLDDDELEVYDRKLFNIIETFLKEKRYSLTKR